MGEVMPEKVDKLISLAGAFFAAHGRIIEARGADIEALREASHRRRLDYERAVPDHEGDRTHDGYLHMELILMAKRGEPPTRRWVALDRQGRVVGALSQLARDGWVEGVGTTREVLGCGPALLMTAALSSERPQVDLLSLRKMHRYYARLGFDDANGSTETDTLRHMVLRGPNVARIRRAAPQVMSL